MLTVRDAASIQSPIENAAEQYYSDEQNRTSWKLIVEKLRVAGAAYTIDAAIYMNDAAFVKEQLTNDDAWVNRRRGAQTVPLRVAARTGRIEICRLLLEHKSDPNAFEEGMGYPIIVDAVRHPKILKLLIDHGANLRRRITWHGNLGGMQIIGDEASALHYAVRAGNLNSVKLLVEAGLDPNAADTEGQTPLHIAILIERYEREWDGSSFVKIVDYLVENDASLEFADKSGRTPLELARKLNSPIEIQQVLDKRAKEIDRAYSRWSDR
jgi:hypothetical protein